MKDQLKKLNEQMKASVESLEKIKERLSDRIDELDAQGEIAKANNLRKRFDDVDQMVAEIRFRPYKGE